MGGEIAVAALSASNVASLSEWRRLACCPSLPTARNIAPASTLSVVLHAARAFVGLVGFGCFSPSLRRRRRLLASTPQNLRQNLSQAIW